MHLFSFLNWASVEARESTWGDASSLSILVGIYLIAALALVVGASPLVIKLIAHFRDRRVNGQPNAGAPAKREPFISVHMAIHDEPPEVVIASLSSLQKLNYSIDRLEVIVMDNNTADERIWKPVESWCQTAGRRFRFFHREAVEGAKAGALNLAMAETDQRATLIATVDADYQVSTQFLARAVEELADPLISYVQFPQAYRNVPNAARGIQRELDLYFKTYATRASKRGSMLLTGTLSVIRRDELESAGCWPTDTITEDAHLGSIFAAGGRRGRFVPEVQGRGLLPLSFQALSRQRFRWAAGNAQVLVRMLKFGRGKLPFSVVAQLCAWLNGSYLILPIWILAALFVPENPITLILGLAFAILTTLECLVPSVVSGGSLSDRLTIFAVRFALLPEGSRGFFAGLSGLKLSFRRTPKCGIDDPTCTSFFLEFPILLGITGVACLVPLSFQLLAVLLVIGQQILIRAWLSLKMQKIGAAVGF